MKNLILTSVAALCMTACNGANNANQYQNAINNGNLRNVNVSRPETSPQMPPPGGMTPSNMSNGNTAGRNPSMVNEKFSTPPPDADKRLPPGKMPPPELKGTPQKKPSP
jgi:hypothetical protein